MGSRDGDVYRVLGPGSVGWEVETHAGVTAGHEEVMGGQHKRVTGHWRSISHVKTPKRMASERPFFAPVMHREFGQQEGEGWICR